MDIKTQDITVLSVEVTAVMTKDEINENRSVIIWYKTIMNEEEYIDVYTSSNWTKVDLVYNKIADFIIQNKNIKCIDVTKLIKELELWQY